MQLLEHLPVEVASGSTILQADFLVLSKKERGSLMAASSDQNGILKVLSLDALLKGILGILLTVVLAISTIVWTKVDDHANRITRAEAFIEMDKANSDKLFDQLKTISATLTMIQTDNARTSAKMESLEELVRKK